MKSPRKADPKSAPSRVPEGTSSTTTTNPAVTSTIAGWPVTKYGSRELSNILRRLLDVVTDRRSSMHPYLWANYVVALGKIVDSDREVVLSISVLHNIGQRRVELLRQFISHWDAINAVDLLKSAP